MKVQRLVVFSPSSFPGTSGDTANYLELVRGFKRKGFKVTLICPQHPQGRRFDEKMVKEGIKVVRIVFNPPRLKDFNDKSVFLILLKLMSFYIVEAFTVLCVLLKERSKFCFVRYGILSLPILPLVRLLGIRCICDVFELPTSIPQIPRVLEKMCHVLDKKLLPLSAAIRIMNYENLTLLCTLGIRKDRILVSHPGLDLRNKPPTVDLHDIPPATFGFFGVLEKWQGVDNLLKAFADVVRVHADSKLYIIGDGTMARKLKQIAEDLRLSDSVIFTGAVPREILWHKYFPRFRVLIIPRPRTYSSFLVPMKLIEGLAAKKVIITTPINSVVQNILKSCTLIVSPDIKSLANAMLKVIEDENLQSELCKNTEDAIKFFDINRVVDDILNMFDRL